MTGVNQKTNTWEAADLAALEYLAEQLRAAGFDDATAAAVQEALVTRNGRTLVTCRVRGTDVAARPEELIRQLWLYRLEAVLGYPRSRIAVEYPITFDHDTSKRADIVVFDADRPTVPYIILEVKQGSARGGKDQLRSYTHATGAPLAVWSNGASTVCLAPPTPVLLRRNSVAAFGFRDDRGHCPTTLDGSDTD